MLLTIIIKALNEAKHIERAIESALAALGELGNDGEVVLADSVSTDQTVDLAKNYPIRIVQLADARDRSCGIGAQLGYVHARGDFLYILDGDMEIVRGFLPPAIALLQTRPELAGVAGLVEEMVIANHGFAVRAAKADSAAEALSAPCLNMGGLYRRKAVEQVGYLTNPNLHAFEEFELGVRLTQAGWGLVRLPIPAIKHYGPRVSSFALLRRRWRTGYACGHGELLRSALFRPYFWSVAKGLRVYRVQFASVAVWLASLWLGWFLELPLLARVLLPLAAWAGIYLALSVAKRSFGRAAYSVAAWHVGILGLVVGFLRAPRWRVGAGVASKVIQ